MLSIKKYLNLTQLIIEPILFNEFQKWRVIFSVKINKLFQMDDFFK